MFGTIRVLVLAPPLGETAAVVSGKTYSASRELVCLALVRGSARCDAHGPCPIRHGRGSFRGVLISAEVGLAVLVFGRSATEHIPSYGSVPGEIALAAQIVLLLPHAKVRPRSISRTDRSALEYTV